MFPATKNCTTDNRCLFVLIYHRPIHSISSDFPVYNVPLFWFFSSLDFSFPVGPCVTVYPLSPSLSSFPSSLSDYFPFLFHPIIFRILFTRRVPTDPIYTHPFFLCALHVIPQPLACYATLESPRRVTYLLLKLPTVRLPCWSARFDAIRMNYTCFFPAHRARLIVLQK